MSEELETTVMTIIGFAGDARSKAFGALDLAKKGEFEEADRLMKEAEENLHKAHEGQTELLVAEAQGKKMEIGVLLIHSQDHLMTAMLAFDLIKEMIDMLKNK